MGILSDMIFFLEMRFSRMVTDAFNLVYNLQCFQHFNFFTELLIRALSF